MNLSVVIPLLNEQDSLEELHRRISETIENQLPEISYEIIFIDDGSSDSSWKVISNLSSAFPEVRGIKFRKNYGKAQALNAAFVKAKGNVVVTMDADLQDFPEEIPTLYNRILNENLDLISGWKQKRKDPVLTKNIPSKLFNGVARKTSGLHLHDFNCGLKAYRKDLVKSIKLRSDMHRYIPVLAKNAGFTKIDEQRVQHAARKHGTSKFGTSRFVNGFLDLITLWFVGKFGGRPMHFFGAVGTIMFIIGFLTALALGAQKLYFLSQGIPARLVTDNAWFYISLTSMIIGSQLFLSGFVAELVVRTREDKIEYQVEEELNFD
ncbi:glycosyltransferase family 2 protein [Weeksellaceae bacterium TAE3-ERU29]|nr:glycosyltransferase family 2 protein [Weeksellaceae bacterium TAE3-ERU29]